MSVKKKILLSLSATVVLLAVGFLLYTIFSADHTTELTPEMEQDITQLTTAEYNSIFCSMYSIEHFAQEDFATYRGYNTLKLDTLLHNTADIERYLSSAFHSGNPIEGIYLGLDPAEMENISSNILHHITPYVLTHSEVTFEVLLPAPSLAYWLSQSEEDAETLLTSYEAIVRALAPHNNVILYFMGQEEWLIANPANYTGDCVTNEILSRKMFLYTFCDHKYQINGDNVTAQLDTLKSLIQRERNTPTQYPDLSQWDMVFFGDSIIGNYVGSFSVPGVVNGLSGARTYNCGKGGIPASVFPDSILSFPGSVDCFIAQDTSQVPGGAPFQAALTEYVNTSHDNHKLCFVISFGLNDYFLGQKVDNPEDSCDETSYAGALRLGISKLQEQYPHATILLMAPTFTSYFSNGTEVTSEKGGVLTEYVDAALQVANEMNVLFLNNYTDLGIDASNAGILLADGIHPTETGRYMLGIQIIRKIDATHNNTTSPGTTSRNNTNRITDVTETPPTA